MRFIISLLLCLVFMGNAYASSDSVAIKDSDIIKIGDSLSVCLKNGDTISGYYKGGNCSFMIIVKEYGITIQDGNGYTTEPQFEITKYYINMSNILYYKKYESIDEEEYRKRVKDGSCIGFAIEKESRNFKGE